MGSHCNGKTSREANAAGAVAGAKICSEVGEEVLAWICYIVIETPTALAERVKAVRTTLATVTFKVLPRRWVMERTFGWGGPLSATQSRLRTANHQWRSIADLGGCGRLFAVLGGTGEIASLTAPRGHPEATPRLPSGHVVANR